MQSLRSRLPTLAIVAAAILCAAAAWGLANAAADTPHATQARNDRTEILRLYEKTRLLELTKADGRVIKKLPIAENEPQPGDVLNIVFDVFTGNHAKHAKTPIGGDHLRCEFVTAGAPKCVSHAVLGRSMLVVEGFPGRITLGTGKYFRATGRVLSSKEVKAAPPSRLAHNDIDVVVRITRTR